MSLLRDTFYESQTSQIKTFIDEVSKTIENIAQDDNIFLFSAKERQILELLEYVGESHSSHNHNYNNLLRRCKKVMIKEGKWSDYLDMMYSLNVSPLECLHGTLKTKLIFIVAARSIEASVKLRKNDITFPALTQADNKIYEAYRSYCVQKEQLQSDEDEFGLCKRIMKNALMWNYFCERKSNHHVAFLRRSLRQQQQQFLVSEAETKDLLQISIALWCAVNLPNDNSDSNKSPSSNPEHEQAIVRVLEAEKSLNNYTNTPEVSKSLILWRLEKHMSGIPFVHEQYKQIVDRYQNITASFSNAQISDLVILMILQDLLFSLSINSGGYMSELMNHMKRASHLEEMHE